MKTLRVMRNWLNHRLHLLPRTVCGALLLFSSARCQAQQGDGMETTTVEGKVQKMTVAPKGEVDGAVLDDGSSLHWPPHLQDRFTKVVVQGEQVRASGRNESGPKGDSHFEVETVTNMKSNISATNPDFSNRRPGAAKGKAIDLEGTVKRVTTAPRGEIDGALLDDGTWLHWPPHLQDRFVDLVKTGEKLRAAGRHETGPKGDARFEVKSITNVRTNDSAENPDFDGKPRGGPHGPGKKHPPHLAGRHRASEADQAERITINGIVKKTTTAPRGEIDGAILDDGTWLHWPPHLEDQFAVLIKAGDQVRAVGSTEWGPRGDARFEVETLTNVRTGQSSDNPEHDSKGPNASPNPGGSDRLRKLTDLERQIEQLRQQLEQLRSEK